MTLTADPATSTDLLSQVRLEYAAREAADARILQLAVAWAEAHPDLEHPIDDDPDSDWCGLPAMSWDAAASFAAANHLSTAAGEALIRDALILQCRLPRVWARLVAGEVPAWRARRIAQALVGQPDDVATYVDLQVAGRAETVGLIALDRILDEAKLRLHAEQRELEQLEALDARYVRLDERSINHTGVADMVIRGDWADLSAFDDAASAVAAALGRDGCPESLEVRRSMAVGILADPERALALLTTSLAPASTSPRPRPKRTILLTYHLTDAALVGVDPVGFDVDGRPLLDQLVRAWCGRDDVRLVVQPLLTIGGCPGSAARHDGHAVEDYRPSTADRLEVELRDRTCVHPYCTRPARHCDCDHVVPFDPDNPGRGPTCPCNLAPLCRRHHRLKTLAGWRYTVLEPGTYLWSDPHGQQFLRTRDGTRDVTDPRP
jgi:hypothetical protein